MVPIKGSMTIEGEIDLASLLTNDEAIGYWDEMLTKTVRNLAYFVK